MNMVFASLASSNLVRDLAKSNQFRRAALPVINNIAEEFADQVGTNLSDSSIPQGSAMEVKSMTYILMAQSYLNANTALNIGLKAEETKKIIRG
jgi:four helix bundle protein